MGRILYRTGNMLEAEERVLLHGCNAQGTMGAGIATAIRAKWPEAYEAYRQQHAETGLALGTMVTAHCGDRVILNAITQERYGRDPDAVYVSYDAMRAVMRQPDLTAWIAGLTAQAGQILGDGSRVAMPLVGAGLARGRWSVIAAIMEQEARYFQPVVYLLDGVVPPD